MRENLKNKSKAKTLYKEREKDKEREREQEGEKKYIQRVNTICIDSNIVIYSKHFCKSYNNFHN